MSKLPTKRRRLLYIISIVIVIALGLASRKIMGFPYFVYEYVGDVLWAVNVYLLFAVLFPSEKIPLISVVTFFFSFLIEFSQIYHAPWIDSIRDTFIGGLVLGYGFLWSDILCYLIGTAIGAVLDSILLRYSPAKN
ncbi:MAG: DUF2809 domain-containing protein [Ignavibacteriae bacterium]|nr:DUF2809 domain-containing protein [Ignavibacteriota bacterium]